jgi:sulfite reductase beta subunit-like hemoprotein
MSTRAKDNNEILWATQKSAANEPPAGPLLGVYPQKQNGLFMQRIKVFGGRISWPQWRKIAELAFKYSSGFGLHITTRQDIELHNIPAENIPLIQKSLAETGLSIFAAGGDSVRNISICSNCDFCSDGFDLLPLAQIVRQYLELQPYISHLPRKFKISFSGCSQACAKPWLNDLGFIAQNNNLFTVIGAGSLGPKPALGIELYRNLPAKDVLPVCIAATMIFNQYGDRENRRRARFRHIREKLGDEAFKTLLDASFNEIKGQQPWPDILPAQGRKDIKLLYRLQLPNGNIESEQALELADIAEPTGAVLRINLEHGLELYGSKTVELPEYIATLSENPIIIACPGSQTCPKAIADTQITADRIRQALACKDCPSVRISISGCPNNCAQSVVSDIGLVGLLRNQEGKSVECYRFFIGGGNGRNDKLAEQSDIIPAQDVSNAVEQSLRKLKITSL